MDEYHCTASPQNYVPDSVSEINSLCSHSQQFHIDIDYTNVYVINARKFNLHSDTTCYSFPNVSKDEMMQGTTIMSWLSGIGAPNDAHPYVMSEILECARYMSMDKCPKVLSIRVDLVVTRASEDETSEEEDDDDDDNNDFEQEEEMEDEDHGLVPADKSLLESLEMVKQEGSRTCAICFEEFHVGVRMPCLHMFHKHCIDGWLGVGNSCPLCRCQTPNRGNK